MRLCDDENRLESQRRRRDCLRHGRFMRAEFAAKGILRADNKALKVTSDKDVRESLRGLLEKVNLAFCYRS